MAADQLLEPLRPLVQKLQVVSLVWHGVPIHLPRFAVYAILDRPVFDAYFHHNDRRMGRIKFGRYNIPVLDPFKMDLESAPKHLVIVSHSKDNRFGLYGVPADHIEEGLSLPFWHQSVRALVKDFV